MYQALYRKWRPKTFDDVIGQPHVTETLKRQLMTDRCSHAYLFVGTRGTGKTSCAKILAKAVNCEDLQDGNPCNVCPACVGIESGGILDVEELDAASNNGVDHVRALRDEAVFTPAVVKKRVYIVDEVHMLSTAAFNALLKILEEPPAHLMFILATTEAHKVPATILSRCQRYAFRRVGAQDIAGRLQFVAAQEGLVLEADASDMLAHLADGSMRDALALLDQCSSGQTIDVPLVQRFLGLTGMAETANLLSAIAVGDVQTALTTVNSLYYAGKDMGALLGELSALLRDVLLVRIAPKGAENLLSGSFDRQAIDQFASLPPERLNLALTQTTEAIGALGRTSNRKLTVELCVIHLCQPELAGDMNALGARVAQLEQQAATGAPVGANCVRPQPPIAAALSPPPEAPKAQTVQAAPPISDAPPWDMEENAPPVRETPQPLETAQVVPTQPEIAKPMPVSDDGGRTQFAPTSASQPVGEADFWKQVLNRVQGTLDVSTFTILGDEREVSGVLEGSVLNIYIDNDFTRLMVEAKETVTALGQAATAQHGSAVQVKIHAGMPVTAPQTSKLDALTQKGFDNIIIK